MHQNFHRLSRQNEYVLAGLEIRHLNPAPKHFDVGVIFIHGNAEPRASYDGSKMGSFNLELFVVAYEKNRTCPLIDSG